MKRRLRLDALLVERGLAPGREEARRRILAGEVTVDGRRLDKAGHLVDDGVTLSLAGPPCPYVGRGGLKLAGAHEDLGFPVEGKTALDAGVSTGGFTDFLLGRGARRVYALDVGRGQVHQRIRSDPRVVLLERTNLRHVTRVLVPEPIELATLDLSFIGLAKVLGPVVSLLATAGEVVALVKPQFEAGPAEVGRGGIVRDPEVHARVLGDVMGAARALRLGVLGLAPSRLAGQDGNREYFLHLALGAADRPIDVQAVVAGRGPAPEG